MQISLPLWLTGPGMTRYAIDSSRLKSELGWKPSITIEEGLEKPLNGISKQVWWRSLINRRGLSKRLGARK